MFPNLEGELARKGLGYEAIAKVIGTDPKTVRRKMQMVTQFKIGECYQIRDILFPGMRIDYLFAYEAEAV